MTALEDIGREEPMGTMPATVINERVDDLPLLIKLIMSMGVHEVLDRYIPRHWHQRGLSWGWVAVIWLAHIISQGDHRKLTVRDWVANAHTTLEKTTGLDIRDTDFTDDRLTILLRHLSDLEAWHKIETDLGSKIMSVYKIKSKVLRCDATTVSGNHEVTEDGLFQFGHSKDDPTLAQIKIMGATADPLGLPLATLVVSGEHADDGLYIPVIDQATSVLPEKGLLIVGDCKMSALAIRAHIQRSGNHYLAPLPLVGETRKAMPDWIERGIAMEHDLTCVYGEKPGKDGEPRLLCKGYEFVRTCSAQEDGPPIFWSERVLVACSDRHARSMEQGLEKRLGKAQADLKALTPAPGPGKRQIKDEAQLVQAAEAILDRCRVRDLLHYQFERQVTVQEQYVGRGRGGKGRQKKTVELVRFQIVSVDRQEEAIAAMKETFGWKAFVTSESPQHLSFEDAMLTYRKEWTIERGFHRLKGAPLSLDPVFVKRQDQVIGLNHLMSMALRVLTLCEFVVARALKERNEKLGGLHAENRKKETDTPTTERLLKAFSRITLTIGEVAGHQFRHITPLSPLQVKILTLLGLNPNIYLDLGG